MLLTLSLMAFAAPLELGSPVLGDVAPGAEETHTLRPRPGRFVAGFVHQTEADVVVTITDPDGERVSHGDFTATGPELFQFTSEKRGVYTLTVSSFEEAAGAYELSLEVLEPVAEDPAGRIRQLLWDLQRPGSPGVVLGVVEGGELTFSAVYGLANLTWDIPLTVDTRMNLGSNSKQFTAMAVVLLEQDGVLSLDDDVRDHIPELPDLGATVTLRHLLTHTSGYREVLHLFRLQGRALEQGDGFDHEELIPTIAQQGRLQNEPGAEWNYNNTGYNLLVEVVERASGASFPEFLADRIFQPLSMHDTVPRGDHQILVPRSSQGYRPDGDGYRIGHDVRGSLGAGGLYTTIPDMARWLGNFESGQVGGPEAIDALTTPFVLTDGEATDYGLGLFVDSYRGLVRVHHGGADIAQFSTMSYYPEIDAGVIVQANVSGVGTEWVARELTDLFLAEHLEDQDEESADEVEAAALDTATRVGSEEDVEERPLSAYVGTYLCRELDTF